MNSSSFTLRFRLAGIPIEIQPFAWILLAFLGGAFRISSAGDLTPVLLFMIAGVICLIAHEMGHALVGRKVGGGQPRIELGGLGGVTINEGGRPKRWGFFALLAAGPLAGALPGIIALLLLSLQIGSFSAAWGFAQFVTLPIAPSREAFMILNDAIDSGQLSRFTLLCYQPFFVIGFWWTVLNLLPIFPLDGGKMLGTLLDDFRRAAQVGIGFSLLLVLFCLTTGSIYNILLAGYLAYINWQHWKEFSPGKR